MLSFYTFWIGKQKTFTFIPRNVTSGQTT